jgi:hypothetical protein
MQSDDDDILGKIEERAHDPQRFVDLPDVFNKQHELFPPVSLAELEKAEQRLGFSLPKLLRILYLRVGNGGFGPGYGLLALNDNGAKNYHANLVDWYLDLTNKAPAGYPTWPRCFVTLCDWGDGITSTLNAADPACRVFRFRGDLYQEGPFKDMMSIEALSLHAWLEDWVNDQPLFLRAQLLKVVALARTACRAMVGHAGPPF